VTLNKMMIIGNLGADPELRYTPSGKAVTNLRVAVNSNRRGADGEWVEETLWLRVEVWDQAAERAAEQLRKGNRIFAEGQLRAREYEASDGQRRTSLELVFARIINLERRPREEGGAVAIGVGEGADQEPAAAAPAVRPRGAKRGAPADEAEMVDVDDIPF
jgi:single-strand DNA-binding protein